MSNQSGECRFLGIKELRLAKQISQSSLCENICSKEYISKIENGYKIPSDKIVKDIFNRLGEIFQHSTQCFRLPNSSSLTPIRNRLTIILRNIKLRIVCCT
ncbi:MAG: helix-turn-helix transcriptional regulator [Lachnospiraceae bacterium]|nr:helix-turn-helix transcriptional regulator [Lachnospiraceae bacterium]